MPLFNRFKRRDTVQLWARTACDGRMVESFGSFDGATYMLEVTAGRREVTECVITRIDENIEDQLDAIGARERRPISTTAASQLLALRSCSPGERCYMVDLIADNAPAAAAAKLRDIPAGDIPAMFAHCAFVEADATTEVLA